MELSEKFKMALMQLKQYSGNNLIIIDDVQLNIDDELEKLKKTWNYSLSSENIWSNFDSGQVKAHSYKEAEKLAKEELKINLDKCNKILEDSDFIIEIDLSNIHVSLEK